MCYAKINTVYIHIIFIFKNLVFVAKESIRFFWMMITILNLYLKISKWLYNIEIFLIFFFCTKLKKKPACVVWNSVNFAKMEIDKILRFITLFHAQRDRQYKPSANILFSTFGKIRYYVLSGETFSWLFLFILSKQRNKNN